ncbi:hypothetical protein BD324DRAFT_619556 [Kockovaella imperatae]|uniref:ferric-chelate reductase (NADPH) n=1 Tax=Kockovaella imperatae TaxID=4999 RepID=A0A1Y1UN06_9TREE|nr:hypothetical protein BD324DRAFT_619556 [Kockovaella imperatae]ORX39399.1 hypothetical protein BD324DRAFT_619556 [Kockovaella imperatae]
MTVTGATTVPVATTSYTPPFKYVTSYPPPVLITGTVTGPVNNNPTNGYAPGTEGDSQYAWAYLNAHMMSTPSYRYAYILWMAFALIALIYIVAHHARLGRGSVPASLSRWSMRRHIVGSKKPGRRNRALPSNGVLSVGILLVVPVVALSIIGPDYIAPWASTFNFTARALKIRSSATAPSVTIQKSLWTLGSRMGFIAFALMPLVVLLALKSPPVAFLSLRPTAQLFADKLATLHRITAWLIWAITTAHVVLWTVQLFQDQYQGIPTWVYLWGNYRFICGAVAYFAMTALMVMSLRPVRKHRYELFFGSHVVLVIITIAASAAHHPVLWYWMAAAAGLWLCERVTRYLRFAYINKLWGRRSSKTHVAGRRYQDIGGHQYDGELDVKQPVDFGYHNPYYGAEKLNKTLPKTPRNVSGLTHHSQAEFATPRQTTGYYDDEQLPDQQAGPFADPYRRRQRPTSFSTTTTSVERDTPAFPIQEEFPASLGRGGLPSSHPIDPPLQRRPLAIPVGYAQAQLLPSRTIRLTINAPRPFRWAAGQSCLLYLPELSKTQSHPFTIINNSGEHEIVILVKARKGLTRKLYDLIRDRSFQAMGSKEPYDRHVSMASIGSVSVGGRTGMSAPPVHVRAWVDGPFGSAGRVPWHEFSTVTIICGGSGVSFGAAVCDYVCRTMAERMGQQDSKYRTRRVRFCWVAREYAEIAWVAAQLYRCTQMVAADKLEISIFVTHSRGNPYDSLSRPQPGFMRHERRGSADSAMSDMSASVNGSFEQGNESVSYADVIDLTNYDDEEDVNDPAEQQFSDRLQHQGKVQRAKSRKAYRVRGERTSYVPSAYPPTRPSHLAYGDEGHGHFPRGPRSMYDDDEAASSRHPLSHHEEMDAEKQYALAAQGAPQALLSPDTSKFQQDAMPPDPRYAFPPPSSGHGMSRSGSSGPFSHQNPFYGGAEPYSVGQDLSHQAAGPFHTIAHARNDSYRSIADSVGYDPFATRGGPMGTSFGRGTSSPAPSIFLGDDQHSIAGDSIRHLSAQTPRSGSMVYLANPESGDGSADPGLWIDRADYHALNAMTEMASAGKPKLATVLEEEISRAEGRMIVATCGPVTLNTVVRNLVADSISPSRIRHGDKRGHVAIYSEDYET